MLLSRINALSLVVPFNLSLSICHIALSTLISAKLRLLRFVRYLRSSRFAASHAHNSYC